MPSSLSPAHDGGEISPGERTISVAAGLVLAAIAAKPRPNMVLSVLALAAGSFLAYRGATGHCPLRAAVAPARLS